VKGFPGDVDSIAVGGWSTLARLKDGSVYAWGANNYGQLGLGSNNPNKHATPQEVWMPKRVTEVKTLAVGTWFTLARAGN
jgi:alpha-tubulin suppressor-like RCC1 family protein